MASFLDYYNIILKYNDKEIGIRPIDFSFSMIDSIYSLYNKAVFIFHDGTGLVQEYLGTTEGTKVGIEYGANNIINSCDYVNKYDSLDSPDQIGMLNGDVENSLINNWYNNQKIRSEAYKDRISNIIRSLISSYSFSSIDIDDTGNEDFWYQPLLTDAKFINDVLLPHCFSNNAKGTPFYCFITSDNVFHLRNFYSMMEDKSVATIEYKPDIRKPEDSNKSLINYTSQVKRWHVNSDKHRMFRSFEKYMISKDDGTLIEVSDNSSNHPLKANSNLPILNDPGYLTGSINLGFTTTTTGEIENQKGFVNSSLKDSMILDRFLIIQQLNPKIKSGKNIQLNIYTVESGDEEKLSQYYSGKYLVEHCEHIWDKDTQRGITKIIVGRKHINLPSSYLLKSELM